MSHDEKATGGTLQRWKGAIPSAICQLPQLKLSCFGCCGYDFASIDMIKKQVAMNTWRFSRMYTTKEAFAETTVGVTGVGICKGIIEFEDGAVGCPLHPARNDGKDLRAGDCLRDYECNALRHYKKFPTERKRALLEFISRGRYDTYTYSLANSSNSIITAFFETETKTFSDKLRGVFSKTSDE